MKKLIFKTLKLLPQRYYYRLLRRLIKIPQISSDFVFCPAVTRQEITAALSILHDSYVETGYIYPDPSNLRLTPFHALPGTRILVAKYGQEVIGTITIIRDGPMGLPLEQAFDLSSLRTKKTYIGELSSLAIKKKFRIEKGKVLFALLKYTYTYARDFMGIDAFIIGVHPKFEDFYRAILLFQPISSKTVINYQFINKTNPVIGLYLDLHLANMEYANIYDRSNKERNLYRFFLDHTLTNFHYPANTYKKISYLSMNQEDFNYFFFQRTNCGHELTPHQILLLQQYYHFSSEVLKKISHLSEYLSGDNGRSHDVKLDCQLLIAKRPPIHATIRNITSNRLSVVTNYQVQISNITSEIITISTYINSQISVNIYGDIQANDNDILEFTIIQADKEWNSYLDYLDNIYACLVNSANHQEVKCQ